MEFSIPIKAIRMGSSDIYLRGHRSEFLNYDLFLSQRIGFTLTNSVDPDEMQHYAAFYLGLHCLPKYPFRGFQYTKG